MLSNTFSDYGVDWINSQPNDKTAFFGTHPLLPNVFVLMLCLSYHTVPDQAYNRVSINVATTWDMKPRFPPPQRFSYYKLSKPYHGPLPETAQQTIQTLRKRFPKLKTLGKTVEEIMSTSISLVQLVSPRPSATTIDEIINHFSLLCYRLTNTHYENTPIAEAIRLGLIIFVIMVWRELRFVSSLPSTLPTSAQVSRLKNVLRTLEEKEFDWEGLEHLRVFVVVMGYLDVVGDTDIQWWTERWKREVVEWKGDIFTQLGDDLQDKRSKPLFSILWLNSIHGQRYRDIASRLGKVYISERAGSI